MPHAEAQDGPGETLDDLFAYDDSLDDVFNAQIPSNLTSAKDREANASARRDLGIDDEVVLARKRKLIAKLDEQRYVVSTGQTSMTLLNSFETAVLAWHHQAQAHRKDETEVQRERARGRPCSPGTIENLLTQCSTPTCRTCSACISFG